MIQAIGGSMLNPVAMSIITNTFIKPGERARAIGVWGGVVGLSLALGPLAGGLLVESVGWRGIFWVNIPVGIAAIVLTALFVPESRAPRARRLDPGGQLLVILLLASLVYALIEGPERGWTSAPILACFAVAIAALVALVTYEPRRAEPLIDLRFFRSAPFSGAVAIAICAFAALGGFLLVNTLYLQNVREFSPLLAGVYTLPMAAMTAIFSPLSGRLVASRGTRLPLLIAGAGITAARPDADQAGGELEHAVPGGQLPAVRPGLRHGQRAHHQQHRVRHAAHAGGRGRGRRLDQPADRRVPRRGRDRVGLDLDAARLVPARLRHGQPRGLVDPGRLRLRWCSCSGWSSAARGRSVPRSGPHSASGTRRTSRACRYRTERGPARLRAARASAASLPVRRRCS